MFSAHWNCFFIVEQNTLSVSLWWVGFQFFARLTHEAQHITRKMQYYLFQGIYSEYEEKTKELTTKADVCKKYLDGNKIDWNALPENVKEVLIDLTYRGDYTGSDDTRGKTRKVIVPAVYKDQQEGLKGEGSYFYEIMRDPNLWLEKFNVDENRYNNRWGILI
ncbi:hypothetical protein A8139_02280 [Marinomonas primoryensis]|uniref:Uncharacterized protein n=1 Tax=Marinomonas primoryensis TaxID=178399 RepID=A0A2Z4PPJ3_9GAMM|nr:hypothetical protein [Marinomonas primoryensis]AWX98953.1 hypothetical protein A8139_02280 [Marinomonas primoryensis]